MNLIKSIKIEHVILFILSFFFSLIFFNDQVAVRGGLIISGEVIYEDNISPLKYYFLNSWTLITQLSAIFLKLGISTKITSFLLVFFLNLILFYSCFLIFSEFTKDKKLSIILSIFLIFFQKNLGDTDYPSLIFTIHTFGAYAQALSGLIIVNIIIKNYRTSLFLILLLCTIHPVIGLWLISIFSLVILFQKEVKNLKIYKKSFILGLLIIFLSLFFFFYFSIETFSYDKNLYNTYLENWDGHRSKTKDFHYEYVLKTLIFLFIVNIFCHNKIEHKFSLMFLNMMIISSVLIYFLFKFFNLNNIGILSYMIPGRFMIIYTFIAWPITLAFLYYKFHEYKYIKHFFYFLVILYTGMHYNNLINLKNAVYKFDIITNFKTEDKVFKKLYEIKDTGNVIATEQSAFKVLYLSKKPLLFMKSFDYLPIHKYLTPSVKSILTEVYGYNFDNPPIKNLPQLNDNFIKKNFENKSSNDWMKIKNNFNSNYLITPRSWKLDLELFYYDKYFNLYRI